MRVDTRQTAPSRNYRRIQCFCWNCTMKVWSLPFAQQNKSIFFSSALPFFRWQLSKSTGAKREHTFKAPANGQSSESGMNLSVGYLFQHFLELSDVDMDDIMMTWWWHDGMVPPRAFHRAPRLHDPVWDFQWLLWPGAKGFCWNWKLSRQETPQNTTNTTSRNKSECFSCFVVPQWNSEVQSGSRTVGNSKNGCPHVDTLPAWQLHLDHATHQGG